MAKIKYIKIAGSDELIPFTVDYENTINGETSLKEQANSISETDLEKLYPTAFDDVEVDPGTQNLSAEVVNDILKIS